MAAKFYPGYWGQMWRRRGVWVSTTDFDRTLIESFNLLVELVKRTCLNIKTSHPWWSLPLFSSLECLNKVMIRNFIVVTVRATGLMGTRQPLRYASKSYKKLVHGILRWTCIPPVWRRGGGRGRGGVMLLVASCYGNPIKAPAFKERAIWLLQAFYWGQITCWI